MPRPYTGQHSFRIVDRRKPNGTVYVYEQESWYDPVTKSTKYKHILKGIRDPQTGEITPTHPRASKGKASSALAVAETHNAMIEITKSVCENSGVYAEVMASLPDNRSIADQILTLAWNAFCNDGSTWSHIENWSQNYQSLLPYSLNAVTKDVCQDLFGFIGLHPEISLSVFKHRASLFGSGDMLAWVSSAYFDSLEVGTDEDRIVSKTDPAERPASVLFLYSVTSRQFVAFRRIPGNISEGSATSFTMQFVKTLDLAFPEVVQDNGQYSESSIGEMLHENIHFITRVDATNVLVNDLVKDCYDSLCSGLPANILRQTPEYSGFTSSVTARFPYHRKTTPSKKGTKANETEWIKAKLNVFICYSSYRKAEEDSRFRKRYAEIQEDLLTGSYLDKESRQFAEQYFTTHIKKDGTIVVTPQNAKIKDALKYHGFLVLLTDKESDINIGLMKYGIREKIEQTISEHQSHAEDDPSSSCDSEKYLDGKLLVEFLGNSMREYFRNKVHSINSKLGKCNGDWIHDSAENLKLENSLKNWLRQSSLDDILQAF